MQRRNQRDHQPEPFETQQTQKSKVNGDCWLRVRLTDHSANSYSNLMDIPVAWSRAFRPTALNMYYGMQYWLDPGGRGIFDQ